MKPNHALLACLEVAFLFGIQNPEGIPFRVARAIHDLHKIGQQLHRRYENQCNYIWATTDKYERRTTKLEQDAADIAASARITIAHQRDPRGWPIIIYINGKEIRIGGVA